MVMAGLAGLAKIANVSVQSLVKRKVVKIDGRDVILYQITERGIKALEDAQKEKEFERTRYGGPPQKRG